MILRTTSKTLSAYSKVLPQRPKWKEANRANFNTSDGTNGCEEMERPRPPLPQKYCHCPSGFTVMNESFRQTFQQNDDHDDLLDLLIRPPLFLSLHPLLGRRHAAVRHSQNRDSKEVDNDDGRGRRREEGVVLCSTPTQPSIRTRRGGAQRTERRGDDVAA